MKRRGFLRWTGFGIGCVGTLGPLAGCVARAPRASTSSSRGSGTADGGVGGAGVRDSIGGVDLPVPKSELVEGTIKDGIPAITDPAFGSDWSGLRIETRNRQGVEYVTKPRLSDQDRVIGVARRGEARAYPLNVLNWHEVVNDWFHGPLLVTYCPLCGSGITAVRRVEGEETAFGVSGYLWKSDLVMYDRRTESLWSQIAATAIRGPRTGSTLTLVPSTLTTWGAWRDEHPGTRVLLPPPRSGTIVGRVTRDYTFDPYTGYDESRQIGIGIGTGEFDDDRLHPKARVLGVASGGEARAYPLSIVRDAGVVNDTVGDRPVVVAVGAQGASLVAYDRRVDGRVLDFEPTDPGEMLGGGTRWAITSGRGVDGPYEGARLTPAAEHGPMYWFAWLDFHPDSTVFGTGGSTDGSTGG